jgi:hypothetical protein
MPLNFVEDLDFILILSEINFVSDLSLLFSPPLALPLYPVYKAMSVVKL